MDKRFVLYAMLFSALVLIGLFAMIGQLPNAQASTPVQFRITQISGGNSTTTATTLKTTSTSLKNTTTTTIPQNNTCNTMVTLFLNQSDLCSPFRALLVDIGQPNSNGIGPGSFSIYYGNTLTNTSTLYPNQSAYFVAHGKVARLYVYQTFDGLYAYEKWAQVSLSVNTTTTTSTSTTLSTTSTVPVMLFTIVSTSKYENLGSNSIKNVTEPVEGLVYLPHSGSGHLYDLTPYELTDLKSSAVSANMIQLVYSGVGSNLWVTNVNPLQVTVTGYTSKISSSPVKQTIVFYNNTDLNQLLQIGLYNVTSIQLSRALPGNLTVYVGHAFSSQLNLTNESSPSGASSTVIAELKNIKPVEFTTAQQYPYFLANFTTSVTTTSASPANTGIQRWFAYSYPGSGYANVPIINSSYGVDAQPEFEVSFNYTGNTTTITTTTTTIINSEVTAFMENGLPTNAIVKVKYDNRTEETLNKTLLFSTPPGNYSFIVYNYTASNSIVYVPENLTANRLRAGSTLNVTFVKKNIPLTQSNYTNSSVNTTINASANTSNNGNTNIYNTTINTSATGVSAQQVNGIINQLVNFITGIFQAIVKAL